jgi:hypothetical protein
MPIIEYPCGCTYRMTTGGYALFPAVVRCDEHRVVTEMVAVVAEAGARIRDEADDET